MGSSVRRETASLSEDSIKWETIELNETASNSYIHTAAL